MSLILGLLLSFLVGPRAASAAAAADAPARTVLSNVHTDTLDVQYDSAQGRLILASRVGTGTFTYHDPGTLIFELADTEASRLSVPTGYGFLGAAGSSVWLAPQTQNLSLIWPGWDTESIAPGVLSGDHVSITLLDVQGPGRVEVFQSGGLGQLLRVFSSTDPAWRTRQQAVGSHVHANWAFSALGTYTLTFQATATAADGRPLTTGPVAYTWVVGNDVPGVAVASGPPSAPANPTPAPALTDPTPAPTNPTPAPTSPTTAPDNATPAPVNPTQAPADPTLRRPPTTAQPQQPVRPTLLSRARVTGAGTVGTRVTCTVRFRNASSVAYAWTRNGRALPAKSSSRLLAKADLGRRIACRATAAASSVTMTSASAALLVRPAALRALRSPRASGAAVAGRTLHASPGRWTPVSTAHSYRWLRDGRAIAGATKADYRLSKADRGHLISVRVTATRRGSSPGRAASAARRVA